MIHSIKAILIVGLLTFWTIAEASTSRNLRSLEEQPQEDEDEEPVDLIILLRDARIECSLIEMKQDNDYDFCIKDVMLVQDLGMASLWPQAEESNLSAADKELRHARIACAAVQEQARKATAELSNGTNFEKCVQEVIDTQDLSVAKTWIAHGSGRRRQLRQGMLEW
jgi:hypothetical protein